MTIVCLLALSSGTMQAQQTLKDIKIDAKGRVFIYFTNYPILYKSQLSDDKLKVVINMTATNVIDSARNRQGTGIVKEVYVQSNRKNISIFTSLSEQQGYTAVQLPYSKAILLETFQWNKLTAAEDNFRTALLAMEDNIIDAAKRDLLSATMEQEPYSAFYLGMIFLSEGKVNSALKYLEFADNKSVDIPDLYAALAQAANAKGLKEQSNVYAERYRKASASMFVPTIPIAAIVETDSTYLEPISHLIFSTAQDSSAAKVDTSELSKRFEKIFKDTVKKDENIIPGVYNEILTYVGGAAAGIILLVLYFYLRWRNKQMALQNEVSGKKEKVGKKPMPKEPKSKVADSQDSAKKLMASKLYGGKAKADKPATKSPTVEKAEPTKAEIEKQQSIENLLQTIRAVTEEKLEKEAQSDFEYKEEPPPAKPVSAKVEIAMNLANEQRKIKQRNIDSLNQGMAFDVSKLNEVAKKLGIEKGSLETKKAIEGIEKDEESLKKLQEKFFKR